MKLIKLPWVFLMLVFLASCGSDKGVYGEKAIEKLDTLTSTIAELGSCSFTIESESTLDSIKRNTYNDIYLKDSNKMYLEITTNERELGMWPDRRPSRGSGASPRNRIAARASTIA